MSINEAQRVKLKVVSWDASAAHGVVCERSGFSYPVTLAQLGPEFKIAPPREGEFLEGVIAGPGQIKDVIDPKTERIEFSSVGPNPDGAAIADEIGRRLQGGTPDTGLNGGRPHDGRFSDGREVEATSLKAERGDQESGRR